MQQEPDSDTHVLVVEDDPVIRETTQLLLQRHGFDVTTAEDGLDGLAQFGQKPFDLAILDIMMPGMNGTSLCGRIRQVSSLPILMLTARDSPTDIVIALEAGADDYIIKPFDGDVLVARIRAALRRATLEDAPARRNAERVGDLIIERETLSVSRAGAPLALTATEMRLLLALLDARGVVLSRESLLEQVWGMAWSGDSRLVDVHVQRLRKKVGGERIKTVRGFGYRLDENA